MNKKYLYLIIIISVIVIGLVIFNITKDDGKVENNQSSNTEEINNIEEDIDLNQVVEIKDIELEKIIREKVNKLEGDILVSDMEEIYSININYEENPVYELDGLEYAKNLEDFSYRRGGPLKSLKPISNLKQLSYLNIGYANIEDISLKFNTPLLDRVSFVETNISNCDFLKDVTSITSIIVTSSELESIDFLTNMMDLESAHFDYNNLSNINSLKDKTKLIDVSLHKNQISDISVLETCTSLETVNISYNNVNNIEYLIGLENLYEVTAYEELDKKIISRDQISTLIDSGVNVLYHG